MSLQTEVSLVHLCVLMENKVEKSTKRRKTALLFLDITGVKLKLPFHSLPEDGAYGLEIQLTIL